MNKWKTKQSREVKITKIIGEYKTRGTRHERHHRTDDNRNRQEQKSQTSQTGKDWTGTEQVANRLDKTTTDVLTQGSGSNKTKYTRDDWTQVRHMMNRGRQTQGNTRKKL